MIYADIQKLIDYSVRHQLIAEEDRIVVRNMLMDVLCVYDWEDEPVTDSCDVIDDILAPLIAYAFPVSSLS